ncbi:hypothetical protein TPB0596_18110 [Tsukamurella pulmonis]|uniref:DUF3043 domain-containing protein n=1 Tax=Tsukamurella pulmonis TaxID=47312 RepID=A0A1H1G1V8_9ACTN|nr:hypothetical protein TPB0596_18110 [Tsukamurella pulmonis]SDR06836.1 Protein of unknown function [Tsukamurella pulmonis]SUP18086.1 Protein of uncharacterised function (DUF3043) [Tsukamurella pulmonis]
MHPAGSNTLDGVKLPWQKADDSTSEVAESAAADTADETAADPLVKPAQTPGKGRPTPSRREAQGRKRGPVAPAPMTRAEARARKKELRNSMSKEERKAAAAERRTQANERRELMMQGDERYLPARDQGPVKAYVRDLVDAKRHVSTMFIPLAVAVMVFMFVTVNMPEFAGIPMLLLLVMITVMAIEGILTGRRVNNRVRERWPDTTETGFRLGWYAFMRSTQLRRMRIPRPRVKPGDAV